MVDLFECVKMHGPTNPKLIRTIFYLVRKSTHNINNFGADVPFSVIICKTTIFIGNISGHKGRPSVFSTALSLSFCYAQYEGTKEKYVFM